MNCPHCGGAIVRVTNLVKQAQARYREDVAKAQAAIAVLERVAYPELYDACQDERVRLLLAIERPAALYAIYRRADKKTPVAYGMVAEDAQ